MQIINQQEYDDWKANNADDAYGNAIFNYAERWADAMEEAMADGDELEAVAERLGRRVDTEGITGFMYGAAVSILTNCWAHGERLRRWHNLDTQMSDEGVKANEEGGVLNPAILNIG